MVIGGLVRLAVVAVALIAVLEALGLPALDTSTDLLVTLGDQLLSWLYELAKDYLSPW
jgi:hypothetical protein